MNKCTFIFSVATILIISCSKDNTSLIYPRTFVYQKTQLKSSEGVAIKDNKVIEVVGSRAGQLSICYDTVTKDFKKLSLAIGSYFVNSFTLLSKDSIELTAISNTDQQKYTFPSLKSNAGGLLIDTTLFPESVIYDSIQDVIKACIKVYASLPNSQGSHPHGFILDLGESCDSFDNPLLALNDFIAKGIYEKGDTLGVYFLDIIYK